MKVKLGAPVEKIWSAAKKIGVLMPKILPDVFSSCDVVGDGGPGTIRVYHCGPGKFCSRDQVFGSLTFPAPQVLLTPACARSCVLFGARQAIFSLFVVYGTFQCFNSNGKRWSHLDSGLLG